MLEIKNVTKAFKEKVAVNNISISIEENQIFGLLGPNGAGKSTLMRLILNIIAPDEGKILWEGTPNYNIEAHKLGYLPEMRGLYPTMKVIDHIVFFLQLKGFSSRKAYETAEEWLEIFELSEWKNRKIKKLSKGMQQKVQLICAFANIPELLILDEPFSGLDPINAQKLEEIIPTLLQKGTKLIILSTHQMAQAEKLCNNIALINNGKIVKHGNIEELKQEYFDYTYIVKTEKDLNLQEEFPFEILELQKNVLKFKAKRPVFLKEIVEIVERNNRIIEFIPQLPSLRDIFIKSINDYEN